MDNTLNVNENNDNVKQKYFTNMVKRRLTVMGVFSAPILIAIATIFTVPQMLSIFKDIAAGESVSLNIFASLIATILAEIVTIVIALAAVWGLKEWRNLLMLKNFKWKPVLFGLLIGVLLFIGLQVIGTILSYFGMSIQSSDTSVGLGSLTGWQKYLTLFILTPIFVPFLEELFFRGYVLNFIRKGIGTKKKRTVWAVIISVIYFAFMHFQGFSSVTDFLILFWVGLIAFINAMLVIKHDSLYPAVAVHIAYNSVTTLAGILLVSH